MVADPPRALGARTLCFFSNVAVGVLGCSSNSTPPQDETAVDIDSELNPALVVDLRNWQLVEADLDPFIAQRPPGSASDLCPSGYGEEEGVFEIETDQCRYATLRAELALVPTAGECLRFSFWHLDLTYIESAEAYLAFALGDKVLYEQTLTIPRPSGFYNKTIVIRDNILPDASAWLHLHNHGANSWRFESVFRVLCPEQNSNRSPD